MPAKDSVTTPSAPPSVTFQHGDKNVFILIPYNSLDAEICLKRLEEISETVENVPTPAQMISVSQIPLDSILYVMHPVKRREKTPRGKFRIVRAAHLSRPIDVLKEAVAASGKNSFKTLDVNKLSQLVTSVCANDPKGRFFRGQVSGEGDKNPAAVVLRIMDM